MKNEYEQQMPGGRGLEVRVLQDISLKPLIKSPYYHTDFTKVPWNTCLGWTAL